MLSSVILLRSAHCTKVQLMYTRIYLLIILFSFWLNNHNKISAVLCLVTQSCPTLCDPMDCSPLRLLCPWGFSSQEYWSGLPCSPSGDLPNPGIELRSPTLHAEFLPPEPPGKPSMVKRGYGIKIFTWASLFFPPPHSFSILLIRDLGKSLFLSLLISHKN